MSYRIQCVQVRTGAAGSGASGSTTTSARLFAFAGTPCHASGGDTPAPSQLNLAGISALAAKAGDTNVIALPADVHAATGAATMAPSIHTIRNAPAWDCITT